MKDLDLEVKKVDINTVEIFRSIWHSIWVEEGYASPNEKIVEKYEKYDDFSTDFLLFYKGEAIGTVRVIKNSKEYGLPTLNDFETSGGLNDKRVIEMTLLTIKKSFRNISPLFLVSLMKAVYQYAKAEDIEGVVVAADRRLYWLLIRMIKLPFQQIGREKMYEGSITYPAYLDIIAAEKEVEKTNPDLIQFLRTN